MGARRVFVLVYRAEKTSQEQRRRQPKKAYLCSRGHLSVRIDIRHRHWKHDNSWHFLGNLLRVRVGNDAIPDLPMGQPPCGREMASACTGDALCNTTLVEGNAAK